LVRGGPEEAHSGEMPVWTRIPDYRRDLTRARAQRRKIRGDQHVSAGKLRKRTGIKNSLKTADGVKPYSGNTSGSTIDRILTWDDCRQCRERLGKRNELRTALQLRHTMCSRRIAKGQGGEEEISPLSQGGVFL